MLNCPYCGEKSISMYGKLKSILSFSGVKCKKCGKVSTISAINMYLSFAPVLISNLLSNHLIKSIYLKDLVGIGSIIISMQIYIWIVPLKQK